MFSYIAKYMNLEKSKRPIFWNGWSTYYRLKSIFINYHKTKEKSSTQYLASFMFQHMYMFTAEDA